MSSLFNDKSKQLSYHKSKVEKYLDKGKNMDLIVMAFVAVLLALIAVVIAMIRRKKIRTILIYAISGLIIGLPIGYFLAPTVISFF